MNRTVQAEEFHRRTRSLERREWQIWLGALLFMLAVLIGLAAVTPRAKSSQLPFIFLGFIALAIGLPLALGAAGLLRHQLSGISPFDPVSFVAVTLCVLTALICACWLPARRAAQVDPMEALRYE